MKVNFLGVESLLGPNANLEKGKNTSLCNKALHKALHKEFSRRGRAGRERKCTKNAQ